MFEKLSPEYQVNKRIRSFLLHSATQQGIEPENARMLFKSSGDNVSAHLYDGGRHVNVLPISGIIEFFGQDYKESHAAAVNDYLHKLANEEQIAVQNLHLVICNVKNAIGAHIFDGPKYLRKIPTLDLIAYLLRQQDEP